LNPPRKLLLIGWDAADWKLLNPLIEAGEMPHLSRLVEEGCMGRISTIHPVYSPMVWSSIATGKRPYKHGVLGFTEPLADGSGIRPISGMSRKTKAFWNIFNQQGWRGHVVGWWPSHPAECINGAMISNLCHHAVGPVGEPWPVPPGGIHPPEYVEALAELRFHPNELHVAMIEPFIPRVREIDQAKDKRLAACMKILAEAATVQSWAVWLLENTQWDYMAVYFDAIDHFGHGFMKYHPPKRSIISERDFELYSGVVAQAARFHDVMLGALLASAGRDTTVILLSDHGFHTDELRPSFIAPIPAGPAEEHSDFGILVLCGPGLKKDEMLHGASVLDIAPTLLALENLPVGEDMDGHPLLAAWEQPPVVRYVPSWDEIPGEDGRLPAGMQPSPASERAALEQLIALGYVQRPPDNVQQAVAETERELRMNLAEAYMDGGLEAEALPILRKLATDWPDEYRFSLRLAMCCKALGRVGELRETVESLQRKRPAAEAAIEELKELRKAILARAKARKEKKEAEAKEDGGAASKSEPETGSPPPEEPSAAKDETLTDSASPEEEPLITPEETERMKKIEPIARLNTHGIDFLRAIVAMAENKPREALECLREAEKGMTRLPGLYIQIGEAWLRLGKWEEALASFERVLKLDPHNPHGFVGQARCFLSTRRWEAAAGAALNAVNLIYFYPLAHFLLGIALLRLGYSERAALAWKTTLDLNPAFWPAHLRLARLLKNDDPEAAAGHREQAREIREHARAVARGELPRVKPELRLPAHQASPIPPKPQPHVPGGPALAPFPPELLGSSRPPFTGNVVTLVTGLPRSGTSLLMQMLAAGGIEPLTDGVRTPDADNPRGYYELEAVKSLARDSSCLAGAAGKVVKVILPLLPHIPPGNAYHVLLIERDLDEIFASQKTMLDHSGKLAADPDILRPAYEGILRRGRQMLAAALRARTLRLSHKWVLTHAMEAAEAIAAFLGQPLDVARMAAVVDPALYRSGGAATGSKK